MRVREMFAEEVRHIRAQREHVPSGSPAQRYIFRELRTMFSQSENENERAQIAELERTFRRGPTAAVKRELNLLRRNGVNGKDLLRSLMDIYHQHRLADRSNSAHFRTEKEEIPRVVCSESFQV